MKRMIRFIKYIAGLFHGRRKKKKQDSEFLGYEAFSQRAVSTVKVPSKKNTEDVRQ